MGAQECAWVLWEVGYTGSTKTRQAGGIQGLSGQYLGAMAGEISPDIMFWGVCQKLVCMSANGYSAVLTGADRCINKEGGKNKAKRAPNG